MKYTLLLLFLILALQSCGTGSIKEDNINTNVRLYVNFDTSEYPLHYIKEKNKKAISVEFLRDITCESLGFTLKESYLNTSKKYIDIYVKGAYKCYAIDFRLTGQYRQNKGYFIRY